MISLMVVPTPFMLRATSPFSYGLPEVCSQFFSSGKLNASHHTAVRPNTNARQVSMGTPTRFMIRKISSGMVEPPM